jgi:hypothetical protein
MLRQVKALGAATLEAAPGGARGTGAHPPNLAKAKQAAR